jgi:hypothetical protein
MLRHGDRMRWCDRASIAALLSLTLLAPGCSGIGGIGGFSGPSASKGAPSPAASSTGSLSGKLSSLFSGSSATSPQPVANAPTDVDCPYMKIRDGAATLTIGPTGDNAAMSLRYEGTFVRGARQCTVVNGQMVMKVGVEGRIIVGPAGGPGEIDVPLRIAIVDESPAGSKTIVTKLIRIPVTVHSSDDNPLFTHVEDGLSFPLPPGGEIDNYIVYIGFDPLAAQAQEKQKERPRRRLRRKSRPITSAR